MDSRIAKLWSILPKSSRRGIFTLIGLSIAAAGAELAAFAALAAFLVNLGRPAGDLSSTGLLFASAAMSAAIVRAWLAYRTLNLATKVSSAVSVECQRRLLHQPLVFHASFNSARALAMLDKVQLLGGSVLQPLLALAQATVIGSALLIAVAVTAPLPSLVIGLLIVLGYAGVARLSWRRIEALQPTLYEGFDERTQTVQESFAGIRDVILDQSQGDRTTAFAHVNERIQGALASIQALASIPRYLVEGLGLSLIGLLVVLLAHRGLERMVPAIGLLAFAAMRLLPLVNSAFASWQSWRAHRAVITDVSVVLELPADPRSPADPMPFERAVRLDDVTFRYPGNEPVLDHVTLEMPAGSKTGIFGPTGCGKSTLGDLVMALLEPASGSLMVDGVTVEGNISAWQRDIAHVGQQLFLLDAPIWANVAAGDPSPDRERITESLRLACLDDLLDRLDEPVGERGIRLSGGQRQRLGIARAFYKRRPFIVLDEATNALDPVTEARILANFGEGQTMLIIGHRPSALAICDRVFELVDGQLVSRSRVTSA